MYISPGRIYFTPGQGSGGIRAVPGVAVRILRGDHPCAAVGGSVSAVAGAGGADVADFVGFCPSVREDWGVGGEHGGASIIRRRGGEED